MRTLCALLLSTIGATAANGVTDMVAGQSFRCAQRGFWVDITFDKEGRSFTSLNSVGEPGGSEVKWDARGEGRTNDPEDPLFTVDAAAKRFSVKSMTCVRGK